MDKEGGVANFLYTPSFLVPLPGRDEKETCPKETGPGL